MDTLFFWLSKLVWLLIAPDSILYLLLVASAIFLYLGKQKLAKVFLFVCTGLATVIAFIPVGDWLLYPLESRFEPVQSLPEKVDGIIVLSGSESTLLSNAWGQVEVNEAAERNLAFMQLARQYPDARLVFSGGTGSLLHQEFKGADIASKLYQQQGLDTSNIVFERTSRNTYENAMNSKKLVNPTKDETWILITTSWHMPRSTGIFCQQDWSVIPYPVDHSTFKGSLFRINFNLAGNLRGLNTGMREWIGLFAYYFTGKTDSLFPAGCR